MAAAGKSAPVLRKITMYVTIMYVTLYILYALIQGILVNRYYIEDTTSPVGVVVISALFAPLVTVIAVLTAFGAGIKWLATPRTK